MALANAFLKAAKQAKIVAAGKSGGQILENISKAMD
jgi:hypothetical protein